MRYLCNLFYCYIFYLVGLPSLRVKHFVDSGLMDNMNVEMVFYSKSYGRSSVRSPYPVTLANIGRTMLAFVR